MRPVNVLKVVLSGVPTEPSDPSGLEIDICRFLRLIEDLFFFSGGWIPPLPGNIDRPGSTAVPSLESIWFSDVAGDMDGMLSAGLTPADCAEATRRLDCEAGALGTLKAAAAVFGISGVSSTLSIYGCVNGAVSLGGRFTEVSIFSCLAF